MNLPPIQYRRRTVWDLDKVHHYMRSLVLSKTVLTFEIAFCPRGFEVFATGLYIHLPPFYCLVLCRDPWLYVKLEREFRGWTERVREVTPMVTKDGSIERRYPSKVRFVLKMSTLFGKGSCYRRFRCLLTSLGRPVCSSGSRLTF